MCTACWFTVWVEFALLLFIPQIPPLWEVTLCKVAIYTSTKLILLLLLLLLLMLMLLMLMLMMMLLYDDTDDKFTI